MAKLFVAATLLFLFFSANAQFRRYVYYKYDNGKSPGENYNTGYSDTFSAYGNRFRVRLLDTSYNAEKPMALEKLTTKWKVVDYFNYTPHFSFSRDPAPIADMNFDGYDDFLVEERWFYLVFLYNHVTNTFVKSGYYQYDSLPQKIAGYSDLYFDYWEFKFDNWWSYLYTIKNYQRINLGVVELKVKEANNGDSKSIPAYISVRKITDVGDKEILRITSNMNNFDVKKYWQEHIKEFYKSKALSGRSPSLDWPTMFDPIN